MVTASMLDIAEPIAADHRSAVKGHPVAQDASP